MEVICPGEGGIIDIIRLRKTHADNRLTWERK